MNVLGNTCVKGNAGGDGKGERERISREKLHTSLFTSETGSSGRKAEKRHNRLDQHKAFDKLARRTREGWSRYPGAN